MINLLDVLYSLSSININLLNNDTIIEIYSKDNSKIITSIYPKIKKFRIFQSYGYNDIYRTLGWFEYSDMNEDTKKHNQCNGLGCENCDGCAYSSLSTLYKTKLKLNEHISQNITDNYLFIGALNLDDLPYTPSPFKTYIRYYNEKFLFSSPLNNKKKIEWHCFNQLDKIDMPIYIDSLMPELLGLNKFDYKIYGIYNNNAVVWKYIHTEKRHMWHYEFL